MNGGVHSDAVWPRLPTTTPCPSSDFPACSGDHPSWYLAPWQPRLMQTSGMVSTSGNPSILDGKVSPIGFLKYSRGSLWKEVFEIKSSVLPPKRQAWGFRVCASSQGDGCPPPPSDVLTSRLSTMAFTSLFVFLCLLRVVRLASSPQNDDVGDDL